MSAADLNEQRQMAIHLLRSGWSVSEVAQKLERSVSWVHKWQTRFEEEGWAGLQSRSQAPKQHGHRLSKKVRRAVIQTRSELEAEAATGKGLRYIGPSAILARLDKKKVKPLPSLASIGRITRAAGLTMSQSKEAEKEIAYPHLQPTQPHQLVQVDIVPHFLSGGASVACFNALDVVSRYPAGHASARRRSQDAAEFLIQVWQEIGLPRYTQVDNEACFSGGFTHQGVLGKVLRLALFVGTELLFSPVRHPKSNGTVERFHQDYDLHVWDHTTLKDQADVASHSTTFFQMYRHSHHIKALKGQCPHQVHHQQPPTHLATDFKLPTTKLPLIAGRVHFMRRVFAGGTVSVLNLDWKVPKPNLDQGVWVTLDFTLQGATLRIYDAPPDVVQRRCLATYPFPLKEKVNPVSVSSAQFSKPLLEDSLSGVSQQLTSATEDTRPDKPPPETGHSLAFVRQLIPTFIRNGVKTVANFVSTIY